VAKSNKKVIDEWRNVINPQKHKCVKCGREVELKKHITKCECGVRIKVLSY
jgi:hypothetical protein